MKSTPAVPSVQTPGPALSEACAAKIRGSFAAQGMMRHLGARIVALAPGSAEIELPFSDQVTQQHGYFHGGAIGALADIVGGYAGYTMIGIDDGILTVEYKLNIIAPAIGDRLIGRGRVVRSGRTLTVTTADIFASRDAKETQVAVMQQTLFTMPGMEPAAQYSA